jgi:hypothetical protein
VTIVLDSGALIALERNERAMWTRLKIAHGARHVPVTHAGVVGQVWRGHPRQAPLAQALRGIDVRAVDEELGRSVGVLLGTTGLYDVIDAAVVLIAQDDDDIITSDPIDIARLAARADRHVEVIHP